MSIHHLRPSSSVILTVSSIFRKLYRVEANRLMLDSRYVNDKMTELTRHDRLFEKMACIFDEKSPLDELEENLLRKYPFSEDYYGLPAKTLNDCISGFLTALDHIDEWRLAFSKKMMRPECVSRSLAINIILALDNRLYNAEVIAESGFTEQQLNYLATRKMI